MDAKRQTLCEKTVEGKVLLGPGREDNSTEKTRCMRLHRISENVMQKRMCLSLTEAPLGRSEQRFPGVCRHIKSMPWEIREFKGAENSEAPIRMERRIRASGRTTHELLPQVGKSI